MFPNSRMGQDKDYYIVGLYQAQDFFHEWNLLITMVMMVLTGKIIGV